jgi:CheY-like chemotaxis protein
VVNGRVLLVDGNLKELAVAETLLRQRGLDARVATDGPEACDCALQEHFAVVVLELNLPGMNGFEVLRRLRSRFETLRPPDQPHVLIVSSRTEPEVERFVRRLGADAFLRKPVEPYQFITTVEHLLAAPRGTVAVRS